MGRSQTRELSDTSKAEIISDIIKLLSSFPASYLAALADELSLQLPEHHPAPGLRIVRTTVGAAQEVLRNRPHRRLAIRAEH